VVVEEVVGVEVATAAAMVALAILLSREILCVVVVMTVVVESLVKYISGLAFQVTPILVTLATLKTDGYIHLVVPVPPKIAALVLKL
jgi:hypothetical protein